MPRIPNADDCNGIWSLGQVYRAEAGGVWYDPLLEPVSHGTKYLVGGGYTGSAHTNRIDMTTISSVGTGADYGDLIANMGDVRTASSGAGGRMYFALGYDGSSLNHVQFITSASGGTATDSGNFSYSGYNGAGTSNGTLGIWFSGIAGASPGNTIEYITLASGGDTDDWGDQTYNSYVSASASHNIRGIHAGGYGASYANTNNIEYILYASAGNADDFGDLTQAKSNMCGSETVTKALFLGGYASANTDDIDHITIMTTANATDAGTLFDGGNAVRSGTYGNTSLFGMQHDTYATGTDICTLNMTSYANSDTGSDLSEARGSYGAGSGD
jgi:hypothetical protein